jgi:hypothetical protein
MKLITQTTITARFVLLILVLVIIPVTARSGRSQLPNSATATIVDTLGAATPTTKFSLFWIRRIVYPRITVRWARILSYRAYDDYRDRRVR